MKKRLDQFLAENGVFESRARAKAAVMEGRVSVNGSTAVKPGTQVSGEEAIDVSLSDAFVSRGGGKLCGALPRLGVEVSGLHALDVGASTGGFTDCLLREGASRVTALDVGKGLLHWKLRNDRRVEVVEGVNARDLEPGSIGAAPDIAVIDVSFISLKKVIAAVAGVLAPGGPIVALVKPQFEAGRGSVGRGGVVRDPGTHTEVLADLAGWLTGAGLVPTAVVASTVRGPKGNIEFFLLIERDGIAVGEREIEREVLAAHGIEV